MHGAVPVACYGTQSRAPAVSDSVSAALPSTLSSAPSSQSPGGTHWGGGGGGEIKGILNLR